MRALTIIILAVTMTGLWLWRDTAATDTKEDTISINTTMVLCGRRLAKLMGLKCDYFYSPEWADYQSVEEPARPKRELGLADVCCTLGCTYADISEYCVLKPDYLTA